MEKGGERKEEMEEEDAKQLSGQDEETDRAHDRLAAAGLEDSDVEDDMASMLEIYNETIRDLLSSNRSTSSCLTLLNKQYTIKHDSAGHGTTGSRCFEPDRSCRK
ncbi:hypothetical protein HPP92_006587 [Vanilla planifolia]|uniref:Kinesin motor domain-containing protein n=1 Tax=Vanilla planifolia TaxID=51239 RepID=A0A835REN8_VANPL|nr:hypothetical protein HPP92_006587 [Vanilla planifolia]